MGSKKQHVENMRFCGRLKSVAGKWDHCSLQTRSLESAIFTTERSTRFGKCKFGSSSSACVDTSKILTGPRGKLSSFILKWQYFAFRMCQYEFGPMRKFTKSINSFIILFETVPGGTVRFHGNQAHNTTACRSSHHHSSYNECVFREFTSQFIVEVYACTQ